MCVRVCMCAGAHESVNSLTTIVCVCVCVCVTHHNSVCVCVCATQVKKLRELLRERRLAGINVGTVDDFQGQVRVCVYVCVCVCVCVTLTMAAWSLAVISGPRMLAARASPVTHTHTHTCACIPRYCVILYLYADVRCSLPHAAWVPR